MSKRRPPWNWLPSTNTEPVLRSAAASRVANECGPEYVTIRRDALLDAADEIARLRAALAAHS